MLITDEKQFEQMLARASEARTLVFDLETTGLEPFTRDRLVGVALLIPGGDDDTFYIPFRHETGKNLPLSYLYRLAPLLADPGRVLIGWNVKFDAHFAEADGLSVHARLVDVMLAAHLVNENEMSYALKKLSAKYLEHDADRPEQELLQQLSARGLGKDGIRQLPATLVAPYAEQDVRLTWRLYNLYLPQLKAQALDRLFDEYNDYLAAIFRIEKNGVLIDVGECAREAERAREQQRILRQRMREVVGRDFNPDSVPQVQRVLGISNTGKDTLEETDHPLVPLLLEYRSWAKAAGTFYEPFLNTVDRNCRIHPDLNLTGTISGRLSCSRPNLQALPKGRAVHRARDMVIAPPGYVLMSWDWSQTELRLLAHYTKDEFLLDAFRNKKDIHGETATRLNMPRDVAKRINFGVVYGIGANALAEMLDVDEEIAREYLNAYNRLIPGARRLYQSAQRRADTQRFITMWTGRRRHYRPQDETHKAMSNLIQGGVAEMMRVAITKLDRMLAGQRARIILQIHDEILLEVPAQEVEYWAAKTKAVMEDFPFGVPIVAEGYSGPCWGKMSPLNSTGNEMLFPDVIPQPGR